MSELLKLLEDFYLQNKELVTWSVLLQVIWSVLETIVVPFILSGAFNNIDNIGKFKTQLLLLVGAWIMIKIIGCLSLHFHNRIEPEISKYLTMAVTNSVFNKYEKDNLHTNVSTVIDRLHLIRNNLHDFTHILCTVFAPRFIVLLIECANFLIINKKLGLVIIAGIVSQFIILTTGLAECVDITYAEHQKKGGMYDYLEDLLSNINTIQSTENGYDFEMRNMSNLTDTVRDIEFASAKCINIKQYTGYASNLGIFSLIIFTVYSLHKSGELNSNDTTTCMLLIIGLFDNISEIVYWVPEFTYRLGILKTNDDFLRKLIINKNKIKKSLEALNNTGIEFKNVTFKYPTSNKVLLQDFSCKIGENKLISIYGKSGIGKTTFAKLIFGLEVPLDGSIHIGNKNIDEYDVKDFRKYISYINQNTNNLFDRTVFDNIAYGKSYNEKDEERTRNRIKRSLEIFNLYDIFKNLDKGKDKWNFLDQKVGKLGSNLSGGQKKIIHLLRLELNDNSKIVILDEPSNGLDAMTCESMIKYLKHIKSKGKTILLISHDPRFKEMSDSVIEFQDNDNPRVL